MISYELKVTQLEAEETVAGLAGEWVILPKGQIKVLVSQEDLNSYMRMIAESVEK